LLPAINYSMNEQEFIKNIQAHEQDIHKVCRIYYKEYSREDLMQEIIAETWRSLGKWKNNCKFSTWLQTIARNVCINTLRKKATQPKIILCGDYNNEIKYEDNSDDLIKQLQVHECYNSIINTIEKPYRLLFHKYVYGATFKELEQLSGINANALRVKIYRIKKQIKIFANQAL